MEGLTDAMLFAQVLQPGERSAIMIQNSPQNFAYKGRSSEGDFEIACFYLNVSNNTLPVIVRIDTPIEVDYYEHGGILPFVLRQLMAS